MTDAARLETRSIEKVWGRTALPEPFQCEADATIGEIWFEPEPQFPDILVKYLFTSAKLSVQVHPRDGEAGPGIPGKDECWLVLAREPGAKLALGFCEPLTREAMREAALDGSIEDLLEWYEVEPGDFFYLPAGTVHAIGAGISLVEVQRNSDITFRLFDYGRPRELHLDAALASADGKPHSARLHHRIANGDTVRLVDGPYFMLDHCAGDPPPDLRRKIKGPVQLVPLAGSLRLEDVTVEPGESMVVSALDAVDFSASERCLLVSGPD